MTDLIDDRYLTPTDVADLLTIPIHTLAQWRYLGRGPAYLKVGKHVRYPASDLEAWLGEQVRV